MNTPETIVTAAIVALIVTVATTLTLFARKEVATKNYVFREVSKKAPLNHTHHQSDIIDMAQGEEGGVADEDEPLEKALKFEDRMLAATEAGIEATQEDILEALRNGRAGHTKTLFEDLDWLEDLHEHLLEYDDDHDDIMVTHDK